MKKIVKVLYKQVIAISSLIRGECSMYSTAILYIKFALSKISSSSLMVSVYSGTIFAFWRNNVIFISDELNIKMAMKQIEGTQHYYITENGEVFSDKLSYRLGNTTGLHPIKPKVNKEGRYFIGIYNTPAKREWLSLPRLVYRHFVGPLADDLTIDHINGIKSDNHYSNLEAVTRGDNVRRYYKNKENGKTN